MRQLEQLRNARYNEFALNLQLEKGQNLANSTLAVGLSDYKNRQNQNTEMIKSQLDD